MRIEVLKRWHWIVIGVMVGVDISLWRGSIDAEIAMAGRSTLDIREFHRLLERETRAGEPMLKNIAVYPAGQGVYWISADQLRRSGRGRGRDRDRDGEQRYVPVKIRATTPFVVPENHEQSQTAAGANYTVVDYLNSTKAKNPDIDFSTRWWDREPLRTTLFAAGGAAVIGGLWPSIINLLIGAGYGKRSEKKQPEYDLSRFGQGEPEPSPAAHPAHASEEDLAKLRAVEAELERNLSRGAVGVSSSVADAPASAPAQAPIRQLNAGPLEVAVPDQPREEKHYAGEYYPTVTHVKRG